MFQCNDKNPFIPIKIDKILKMYQVNWYRHFGFKLLGVIRNTIALLSKYSEMR